MVIQPHNKRNIKLGQLLKTHCLDYLNSFGFKVNMYTLQFIYLQNYIIICIVWSPKKS